MKMFHFLRVLSEIAIYCSYYIIWFAKHATAFVDKILKGLGFGVCLLIFRRPACRQMQRVFYRFSLWVSGYAVLHGAGGPSGCSEQRAMCYCHRVIPIDTSRKYISGRDWNTHQSLWGTELSVYTLHASKWQVWNKLNLAHLQSK
jgi:hypothetical protein